MKKKAFKILTSFIVFAFLLIIILGSAISQASSQTLKPKDTVNNSPILDIVLRVIKNTEGKITHVEVTLDMPSGDRRSEKPFILKAPVKYANVTGIADRIEGLQVTDKKGRINLKPLGDMSEAGGMIIWRKWQAVRATSGIVKVLYRSRIPEPKPRRGPPFDLSVQGGGVSGAGCGFMALPDEPGSFKLRLHWDLKQMEPGSIGLSTLGDGDFETEAKVDQVISCFFIAGPLKRYPERGNINGFSSAWLGVPPFEVQAMMAWTAKSYTALRTFFHDTSQESYRFFMIVGPENLGVGGTALNNSFMLFVPTDPKLAGDPRGTIAHEMTHHWIGNMEGDESAVFWFTEGLTVHYTSLLMFWAGLFNADEYLADVNNTVARYLTNPLRNLPNDQIGNLFWQDRNAQVIPYDRGSLYFAQVDTEIRSASKGNRSLDDVILSLFERRKNGEKLSKDVWLEALKKELGPSALTEFDSVIIRGENFVPAPAALGPQFERVPATLHRFELGFDENTFASSEKRIKGLVRGSAAERAGLQDGDRILNAVDLNELRDNDDYRLKLRVRRGDQDLEFRYWPRGEAIEGHKWVLKTWISKNEGRPAKAVFPNVPSVTRHAGTFNGHRVDYTTEIEEIPVSDGAKGPSARLVSFSYIVEGVEKDSTRPVIFIFNGGPIVPSMFLHMAAFGPKRVSFPDDLTADPATFPLVDNTYTVLDAADLVFFDPAGTGFSRVAEGTPPDAYFSVDADARQLTQFVEAWSRRHNRLASPKYLFGESYGTMRAAVAAQQISRLDPPVRLDGVFLMGQALNIIETSSRPQNIMGYVVSLPTLASLGWYHGRVDKKGRTFEQFLDEVRLFARTEFLTALFQGNALAPAERDRLARRLGELVGLPADVYAANNLRITKDRFRIEFLKDKNEVLGQYDGRYKTTAAKDGKTPEASGVIFPAVNNGFRKYAKEDLLIEETNYVKDSPVKDLEGWKWGGTTPFSDWPYMASINDVMARNPNFRVVIGVGYHDFTTTTGASEYAVAQSGWPKDRVRIAHYDGGHMAYSIEKSLKELMEDVRALISGK